MKFYLCQTTDGPQYVYTQIDAAKLDRNFETVNIDVAQNRKGRHIFARAGISLQQRQISDAHELMHPAISAEENSVSNHNMTAQHRAVGHDIIISHHGIMSDVTARHEKILRTNYRFFFQFI